MIVHFAGDDIAGPVKAALSSADVALCLRKVVPNQPAPPLVIRPDQTSKMRLPFVLVHVDLRRHQAEIVGWLCGWQAIERADKIWSEEAGAWFIPPPYHTVQSLEDWIASGARPHWMPENFNFENPKIDRRFPFANEGTDD